MAETSQFVIQYLADISNVKRRIRELETVNKNASNNLGKDFGRAIDIVDRRIKSIRSRPVFDKNLGRTVIKTFAQVDTVFKGTDGRLKTLRENSVLTSKGLRTLNSSVRDGATTARTFGQNLATLAKRALLTIPVWFALRSAILGVFRTIRNGLEDIVAFDNALQKLRRNIEATSSDVDRDFGKAQKVIEEFSLRTGVGVAEITNAIQRFATVGFDFETALEGGLRATQLAITLFGDAEETANAFARSLRVLTEGIDDPVEQQRQIAEALALTDQLWQTNAFEVSEFSNNLEKFAGTARIANLSIEDTLTLLATLSTGGLSNRAGRLLRTTILKSLSDIENITRTLNLDFDPTKQPTIVFIQELIRALGDLRATENVPVELGEVLADLFSVRSTEVLASLTALQETLDENIALTPDIEKFDSTLERLLSQVGPLAKQFSNVNRALGRLFIRGLVGADDFDSSLEKIVNTLRSMTDEAEELGEILREVGKGLVEVAKIFDIILGFASFGSLPLVKEMVRLAREVRATDQALEKLDEQARKFGEDLQKALSGELNVDQLERVIAGVEARLKFDTIDPGFDRTTLQKSLEVLEETLEVQRKITEETQKQNEQVERAKVAETDRKKIAELVLQTELEILSSQGARASQITKAESLIRRQLSIEKTVLDQLGDQLKLEREINEERRLRSEVGSDSLKLFRIAQTEGTEVARKIGDALAGNIDFSTFIRRGGRAVEVFGEQFADVLENQQARAFLRGETVPGIPGLRGGRRIPIEEEAIRRPISQVSGRALRQARLDAIKQVSVQDQTVQAQNVFINTPGNIEALRQLFQAGGQITGPGAQAVLEAEVARSREARRIIDLNLNLDGRNLQFQGTPEGVRALAQQITNDPAVLSALENQIVRALDNPESAISKGVSERIEEF